MLSTAIGGFLMGSAGTAYTFSRLPSKKLVSRALAILAIATAAIAVAASFAFASVPVTGFLIAKTVFIAEAGFIAGLGSLVGCVICYAQFKSQRNANAHL